MTVLSACQSAASRLIGTRPPTIFSSTEPFEQEMADLATEGARDIAESHDWQGLTKAATITGDGVATTFPFPDDYGRQLLTSEMLDPDNWAFGYTRVADINEFLWLQISGIGTAAPGFWTINLNQFHFTPAPADGAQAIFPYISNEIVLSEGGAPKTTFTTDMDTFVLSERLLTLWLVWRWREQKRLEYGADQANFEKAFADIAGKDAGARPIRSRSLSSRRMNFRFALPWALGG